MTTPALDIPPGFIAGTTEVCDKCSPGWRFGMCKALSRDLVCTREKGHEGPHVACGGSKAHNLHSWESPTDFTSRLFASLECVDLAEAKAKLAILVRRMDEDILDRADRQTVEACIGKTRKRWNALTDADRERLAVALEDLVP